jgi:hypothetical protein
MTRAERYAEWLAEFYLALRARAPKVAQQIEWPVVKRYYFSKYTVQDALDEYCLARNII